MPATTFAKIETIDGIRHASIKGIQMVCAIDVLNGYLKKTGKSVSSKSLTSKFTKLLSYREYEPVGGSGSGNYTLYFSKRRVKFFHEYVAGIIARAEKKATQTQNALTVKAYFKGPAKVEPAHEAPAAIPIDGLEMKEGSVYPETENTDLGNFHFSDEPIQLGLEIRDSSDKVIISESPLLGDILHTRRINVQPAPPITAQAGHDLARRRIEAMERANDLQAEANRLQAEANKIAIARFNESPEFKIPYVSFPDMSHLRPQS